MAKYDAILSCVSSPGNVQAGFGCRAEEYAYSRLSAT